MTNRANEFLRHGFTLIELMITVAIIGILASTAVTLFQDQQLRSKRTEGMTNLEALSKLERGYYGEFGAYTAAAPMPAGVPTSAPRNWDAASSAVFATLGFAIEGSVYYSYDVAAGGAVCPGCASGGCFTAAAYGDLDGDGAFGVIGYFHPDAGGNVCTTQVFNLPPPVKAGVPILDAPVAFSPPLADNY